MSPKKSATLFFLTSLIPLASLFAHDEDMCMMNPNGTYMATHHDLYVPVFSDPMIAGSRTVLMSVQDGNWSSAATWGGRVPGENDIAMVHHRVSYDLPSGTVYDIVVAAGGDLVFQPNGNTQLKVRTLQVLCDGALDIDQSGNPNNKAEIFFRGIAINSTDSKQPDYDPAQYGVGLISSGRVHMQGAAMDQTFMRLEKEPKAGDSTLVLHASVNSWKAGDRIVLPDTRQLNLDRTDYVPGGGAKTIHRLVDQSEEFVISSVAGTQITLNHALQYDHLGARDGDQTTLTRIPAEGGYPANGGEFLLPHVGNLTRNVILRSENPAGVRAHSINFSRADVDIEYVLFKDMGRTTNDLPDNTTFDDSGNVTHVGTNQIARYPMHMHMVLGPMGTPDGVQFRLIGNAVDGSAKWGISIHGSHYGLVHDNVFYNTQGAGFVTEDGTESYNVIEHNFVARVAGTGPIDRIDSFGRFGMGFWMRTGNNHIRHNVVAGTEEGYGFVYDLGLHGGDTTQSDPGSEIFLTFMPTQPGVDPEEPGAGIQEQLRSFPVLEWKDNEGYGLQIGLRPWGDQPDVIPTTHVRDIHWHERVVYHLDYQTMTTDHALLRGDAGQGGVYTHHAPGGLIPVMTNSNVQNFDYLYSDDDRPAYLVLIENTYLRNRRGIIENPLRQGWFGTIRRFVNVKADPYPGLPLNLFDLQFHPVGYPDPGVGSYIPREQFDIINLQGIPGNSYRAYYNEQLPDAPFPKFTQEDFGAGTCPYNPEVCIDTHTIATCPEDGMTNAQCWTKYKRATKMEVARCSDSQGFVTGGVSCKLSDTTPPTVPTGLTGQAISNTAVKLSWTASSDPESDIQTYKIYRDGKLLTSTLQLTYEDDSAQEGAAYSYTVSAVNLLDLESAKCAPAVVQMPADTTPPSVASVQAGGVPPTVLIVFSEPVNESDVGTVANYKIDQGVTVQVAKLGGDLKTVALQTSAMVDGKTYTLTMNNIHDRARTPNVIAANTVATFPYSQAPLENQAPSVSAGPDQTVALPNGVQLRGTASDDGLPLSPGRLTLTWSQVSGPSGATTILSPQPTIMQVQFIHPGAYVFRLKADDGEKSAYDDVMVTVTGGSGGGGGGDPGHQHDLFPIKNVIRKGDRLFVPCNGHSVTGKLFRAPHGEMILEMSNHGYGNMDCDLDAATGKRVPSGTYVLRLYEEGTVVQTSKIVVVK